MAGQPGDLNFRRANGRLRKYSRFVAFSVLFVVRSRVAAAAGTPKGVKLSLLSYRTFGLWPFRAYNCLVQNKNLDG